MRVSQAFYPETKQDSHKKRAALKKNERIRMQCLNAISFTGINGGVSAVLLWAENRIPGENLPALPGDNKPSQVSIPGIEPGLDGEMPER